MGMVFTMAGVLSTISGSLGILHMSAIHKSLYKEGGEDAIVVVKGVVIINLVAIVMNSGSLCKISLLPIDLETHTHTQYIAKSSPFRKLFREIPKKKFGQDMVVALWISTNYKVS